MTRPVRALTLWQPWATAIADGQKRYETRRWGTQYRGLLLIHAGRQSDSRFAGQMWLEKRLITDPVDMPSGCIVAVADLSAIHLTADLLKQGVVSDEERRFGDYSPGRRAWQLDNVRTLRQPIRCQGAQGLWTPSQSLVDAVVEQVGAL